MSGPTRREFLQSALAASTLLAAGGALAGCGWRRGGRRPHIILVMCDDLGYGDVGFTGATAYTTPHIDRIAREGLVLRQAYSAAPVCSPTRVALMTGRYPARDPAGLHEPLTTHPIGLTPSPTTLPRLLRDAGYRTALVGKWHLGTAPDYHPLEHGFDGLEIELAGHVADRAVLVVERLGRVGAVLVADDEVLEHGVVAHQVAAQVHRHEAGELEEAGIDLAHEAH
ncbi:MAG TPA: sulfatase-like hydrolase/transferase, partial [Vicinamibacterales bacterium]|nr:sulfatase-like hydrolase/transferase [Vicinamibacterales bacterium]